MDTQYSNITNSEIAPYSRVYVAGHRGMVGSALRRRLLAKGYANLVTRTREQLDLTDQTAVHRFMEQAEPDYVFLAAARVGGIFANNTYRGDFIYENLVIATNVIHAAMCSGVKGLLYLGSSCIYPRDCPQPIKEEYLLTGPLEQTNEPYAIAKIAGLKLCEAFNAQYGTRYVAVMPTNLYGPNDNFDLQSSHVLPALVRKFHDAKARGADEVTIWGTGTPRREFLHVYDLADACVFLMHNYDDESHINVGTGEDLTIRELAEIVRSVVHPSATITFDTSKADGAPRKLLDVSRLHDLGWRHRIELRSGIEHTYAWFLEHREAARLDSGPAVGIGTVPDESDLQRALVRRRG
jgi:GDP-L-fucose synthase